MNMDYKYIEQLLERYWRCETSLEEEAILRLFFRQEELPESLRCYKDAFDYMEQEQQMELGSEFDAKILAMVDEEERKAPTVVRARRIPFFSRLMPLAKAVAVVAILFTIGNVAQRTMYMGGQEESDTYVDTYTDPEAACDQVNSALDMVSEALQVEHVIDSIIPSSVSVPEVSEDSSASDEGGDNI
jgi:hypothetical protein